MPPNGIIAEGRLGSSPTSAWDPAEILGGGGGPGQADQGSWDPAGTEGRGLGKPDRRPKAWLESSGDLSSLVKQRTPSALQPSRTQGLPIHGPPTPDLRKYHPPPPSRPIWGLQTLC